MATELRPAGAEPASRTLTFLFTDIEGSTRLWEQHQQAMKEALERHDAIMRGAVEGSRGQVVKTIGDGFMAVFDSAVDGVCATLDAQRGLAQEPWGETGPLRVRMGLHAGEAAQREDDYFGPTLNRTARIMSAGHGGQVLLSAAAAALVMDQLPDGATLQDLGEHQLKGLGRPDRVFQLIHPKLEADFPPLVTPSRKRVELPEQPSAFIGRTAELDEIGQRLAHDGIRLLTLTGPGGIGKTRLSLCAAAAQADRFEEGVFFVDLSTTRDSESVLAAIAAALGLTETREEPLAEITDRIGEGHLLLVLDNFEQVTPAAPAVAQLLQSCPRLNVLVTSREALHLSGEHLFAVPPLAGSEAVQLFVERARAVKPDFELTDENAAAVAEICARLDGLPLALELATARINLFSPQALLDRLDSSLQLLKSGPRDLPERQQTLRGAIEWSYELLEPGEQRLFELLAAFSGATFDAVESVAATLNGKLDLDALDGLASLVDKSLVRQAEAQHGEPRFVMLATIREYAVERLHASPDFDSAARAAHAAYFAEFAHAKFEQAAGGDRETGIAALTLNGENLRSAWRHLLDARDLDRLNELVDGLWLAYESQGRYQGMVDLAGDFLSVLDSAPPTRERELQKLTLRTSRARAMIGIHGFTDEVEEEFRRALDLFEGERDVPQLFPVLRGLASVYGYRAEFDKALPMSQELLRFADAQDDDSMRVPAHLMMGTAHVFTGDLDGGIEHLESAIRYFESQGHGAHRFQLGPNPGIASYTTAALVLWLRGFPDRALERANRAVTLATALRHPYTMAYALHHASFLHLLRQEPEPMRDRAVGVLDVAEEYDLPIWRAVGTAMLGAARTDLGHLDEGPAQIADGMAQYQGLRSPPVFWPLLLWVRARAFARAGRQAQGLDFIDQAIEISGGAGPLAPLFFATKGDLLEDGAEWYRRGVDYATELGAGMPRLRAAVGLCRAEPTEEHRELLRDVHATFTEGFDTPDLTAAAGLLETTAA
jgi:predicted ATPase/class 3 adenylate cyclase